VQQSVEERQIVLEPPVMAEEPALVAEAEPIDEAQPGFSDNVMPLRMPEPVREAAPEPVVAEAAPAPINEPVERPYVAPRQVREEPRPGPTLFERMMNLSRGADKARAEEPQPAPEEPAAGQDPLEIPRFFRRQVND
jgi:cell division protein FtsZ